MPIESFINHPIVFYLIAFLASLLGTFLLFKFLKASAEIIKPTWRAGGALAGFIIIFAISFNVANSWLDKYLIIEKRYNIEGVVLLDSSNL